MTKVKLKFLSILCLACAFSCKVDPQYPDEAKTGKVSFKVSVFQQSYEPMGPVKTYASEPVKKSPITTLYYWLFDAKGNKVSFKQQSAQDADFCNFTEKLPQGLYTAMFLGSELPVEVPEFTTPNTLRPKFIGCNGNVFSKKVKFEVTYEGTTQPVTLERRMSRLEIVAEDVIPSNVTKAVLTIDNELRMFSLEREEVTYETLSIKNPVSEEKVLVSPEDYTAFNIGVYIMNVNQKLLGTLKFYDAEGLIVKTVNIRDEHNVTCKLSSKTILKGRLIENPDATTTISIKDTWDPDVIVPFKPK